MTTGEDMTARDESRVFKALIWRDWLRMRGWIVWALTFWLVLIWVLLVAGHPAFILIFGMIYVLVGSAGFAAGDVMEGSEEFAFALPPTRAQQYLAKLVLGMGTTLAFTALGVLAIGLDLPQYFWGLFVNSGFTAPFPVCEEKILYGLAIVLPVASFACMYAMSTNATTRGAVAIQSFLGMLIAAAVMGAGFLAEQGLWDGLNGYVSIPCLLALTPMALLVGYGFYLRKEGVNRPAPVGGTRSGWVWVVIVVIVVLVVLFMLLRVSHRSTTLDEELRHRDEEIRSEAVEDCLVHEKEVGTATVPAQPEDNTTKKSGEDVK